MYCKNCGNMVSEGLKYCHLCGTQLDVGQSKNQGHLSDNSKTDKNNKKLLLCFIFIYIVLLVIYLAFSLISSSKEKSHERKNIDLAVDSTQVVKEEPKVEEPKVKEEPVVEEPVVEEPILEEVWLLSKETASGDYIKEYQYDDQGKCQYKIEYGSDGTTRYRLEAKTNMETGYKKWYEEDGSVSIVENLDSQGRTKKETFYRKNGSIEHTNEYEYDSQGNRIRYSEYYNEDGSISGQYNYNEQGKVVYAMSFYTDSIEMYECEFDDKGNEIKSVTYDIEGPIVLMSVYHWDSDNIRIKETYDGDNFLLSITRITYDNQGKRVMLEIDTYNHISGEMTPYKRIEYAYDNHNNLISILKKFLPGTEYEDTERIDFEYINMFVENVDAVDGKYDAEQLADMHIA